MTDQKNCSLCNDNISQSNVGRVHAVIGPVVDVHFEDNIPEILNAIEVVDPKYGHRLVLEVTIYIEMLPAFIHVLFISSLGVPPSQ